ncbi:hypothetical protein GPECTOR_11g220 [Gonium pectorale]|uniref:Gcp-like domain-containing protein n=1 Tax=Gonium pectorale TaxID=33097 RepID=A0A150GPL8_GONPE|nr:hypothetical protein GPECTOR_11g220 [Gonium pectorale]|eukprot:KXZ51777.1 hypothetical protein GPECTOR_11g220 [Gonium pectorale]
MQVLGEAIATQADIHAQWGGVVPNLARDAHAAAIDAVVDRALAAAGLRPQQLSAIAVTIGPGLGLCLRASASFSGCTTLNGVPAEQASSSNRSSSSGNNGTSDERNGDLSHTADRSTGGAGSSAPMPDASAVASDVFRCASVPFPFLCLLVSGGHNLLVLVRGVGDYVQLGTTVDDALGEAYDKVARLLELELRPHGGAALEALARDGDPRAFRFAVPMRKYATCDFSFAGLKTSSRLAIEQRLAPALTQHLTAQEVYKLKADIAASFQSVAVTHLMEKTRRGVTWARELAPGLRHLVVAGGVACNKVVRASLQDLTGSEGLELVLPPPRWCTDNGVMVAWAGIERIACGWAEPPPPPLPLGDAATEAAAAGTGATEAGAAPSPGLGAGAGSGAGAEWIELKPRWPLTSELHPKSEAARREERRSVKKVRMFTALSDLVPPAASGVTPSATGVGPSGGGGEGGEGESGSQAALPVVEAGAMALAQ